MISVNNFYSRSYSPPPRRKPRQIESHPGQNKNNFRIGSVVLVAEKINYRNGKLTKGTVIKFLTPRPYHPRGIKVLLDSGKIGRVQDVVRY